MNTKATEIVSYQSGMLKFLSTVSSSSLISCRATKEKPDSFLESSFGSEFLNLDLAGMASGSSTTSNLKNKNFETKNKLME